MEKPSFSLSRKFFLLVLIILLPVIAGFFYSYSQDKKIVVEQSLGNLTALADAYEGQVYAFIEMSKRRIEDFSSDGFIADELERFSAGRSKSARPLKAHLVKNKLPLDRYFKSLLVMTVDGMVAASTIEDFKIKDASKAAFFTKGVVGAAVTEGVPGHHGGRDIIISAPVRSRKSGRTVGVIAGIIPFSALDGVLTGGLGRDLGAVTWKGGGGRTKEVYLADGEGRIIADSRLKAGPKGGGKVKTLPVRACLESGREISEFFVDYRGVEVAGASMCLPSLEWTLVVKYDAAEVLHFAKKTWNTAFLSGNIAVGGILLFFLLFYKDNVRSLKNITKGSLSLAKGDYDVKIPVGTNDEIGVLTSVFNKMALEIRTRKGDLLKTLKSLKKAQHMAGMGSWEWDLTSNNVIRSEEVYRIFGLKEEEFEATFEAFLNAIHPDDRKLVKSSVDGAIHDRKPYSVDYRIVRPGGEVRTIHGEAEVIFDGEGKPLRMEGTVQDITERKKKEEEERGTIDRIARQRGALLYITKRTAERERSLGAAFRFLTEISAKTLKVERVSIWLFSSDRTELRCKDIFELATARHKSGEVIMAADYPEYFKALDKGRAIDAHDARSDQRTRELGEEYLKPNGITSMLDAPIRMGGKVIGVVCHEHVGPARRWAEDEITFAADIADQTIEAIMEDKRRGSEKALRASELRYRTLFDTAGDAVVVIDGKEKIWGFNRTAEKMFGYSVGEIVGRDVKILLLERYRKAHHEAVKRTVETGNTTVAGMVREYEALRKDGTEFPVSITMSPTKMDKDYIFLAIIRDITERKKKEYELKKFSSVLEHAMNGVVITDPEGNIEYVNPVFEKITGYSREEVLGRKSSVLASGQTTAGVYNDLWKTITAGSTWQGEFKNKKKTGEYYWCKNIISPVMGEDGRIKHFFSIQEDVTEKMVSERKFAYMASHDPLTGLLNRSRFASLLNEWVLSEGVDAGDVGALFLVNVDRFMFLNDTYGHAMGDVFLRRLGKFVNDSVSELYGKYAGDKGKEPLVARLSGDELAVFLPAIDAVAAAVAAEELRKKVEEARLGVHGQSTVSVGVVLYPEHGKSVSELLMRVDAAMMRAKELGRNRCHLYRPEDKSLEKMHSRLEWKAKIVSALKEDRFEPWFQPILSLKDNTVTHYEALARMIDEKGEVLFPGSFIETAEVFGLIGSMDRVIIRKALDLQERMKAQGKALCFSLNLSGVDLGDEEFLSYLKKEFTGRENACVIFEITETAAVKNMDKALHFIKELKKLGCRFSLDDFGVGFTSFNYLKEMDVDYIKIDGSFIRRLHENPDDQLFVKAMIDVARGMRIKTVAEFVETEESLNILKKFKADYAQGYFVGRPGRAFF